jgi:phospholipid/cholesterol/gamma-HCH transport system substrate-binding protein
MSDAENRTFELKVGIFITVAIVILGLIVSLIGDVHFFRKGYNINVLFNFANGITENSPVRLAGVNIGQVEKIGLFFDENERRTRVRISTRINDKKIRIEEDATVVINTLGLLGEKYIEIFPGLKTGTILKSGDEITGRDPVPTEVLTSRAEDIANAATVILTRLKDGEGTIGKLLVEEKFYNDLEGFMEDIRKHPWKLLHKPKKR